MANLKVNADKVIATANKIKGLNKQMRDGFSNVEDAIKKLNNSWDGSASNGAFNKFNAIKNSYCNARYKVVDGFVAFLYQQVGEGYTQTEAANKSLADQFK